MFAFLAAPLARYVLIGVALAALFGLWQWERHDRIAAEKGEKAARLESELHAQDAARWQAAAADRDTRITDLASKLNEQSALVEQSRAKESELLKSLDRARIDNDRMQQDHDELEHDLAEEATRSPQSVVQLGPIVLKRAPELFK